MDHAAAERLYLLQRPGQVVYGEVGQKTSRRGRGPAHGAQPARSLSVFASPPLSCLGSSGPPSRAAQKRRARSGSSAGNSSNDSCAPGTAKTIAMRRTVGLAEPDRDVAASRHLDRVGTWVASSLQPETGQGLIQAAKRMEAV